jgi:hypothetical protein
MKRFLFGLALAAGLQTLGAEARATSLSPGNTVSNPGSLSLPSGSIVDSGSTSVSSGNGSHTFSGTLYYALYKESNGNLDFLYQVQGTGGNDKVTSLTAGPFTIGAGTGTSTNAYNVGYLSSLPAGGPFPSLGTTATSSASLSSSGGDLKFNFGSGIGNGKLSDIMVVETKARNASPTTSTIALKSGTTLGGVDGMYAPTPEPTSLVLLGGCLAGLGIAGAWKRRKAPVAVS